MKISWWMCVLICLFSFSLSLCAGEIPKLITKDGRHALLVDGKPYFMLGAQVNNSSAWPAMLPEVWSAIEKIHANTMEAPVYWEQLEPQPGQFDFSVVDQLVQQARAHHVHLVLLWFGGWKNGSMHYIPEWMKTDTARYPRMWNADHQPMDILSVFSKDNLDADRHAFVTLMGHLKQLDSEQHTVLMVQVENEPGSYGTVRDFSPPAQKVFDGQVPSDLINTLHKQPRTWQQVFGDDASETFSAYSAARYIDQIAAAGKAAYALPMYVNVALRDPDDANAHPGANYPSGGATYNMLDVWKAAAPSIDILAPDIYLRGDEKYSKILASYNRPDNALFVPETANIPNNARYLFLVLGQGGIGFSPFGIDRTGYSNEPLGAPSTTDDILLPFAEEYTLLTPMDEEIARLSFEGKLKTTMEVKDEPRQQLDFGKWQVTVSYGLRQFGSGNNPQGNPNLDGRALVAQLEPDEFLVTGIDARVDFSLSPAVSGQHMQYLRVEEGHYENGEWKFMRIWNGDQTDWGLNFKHVPHVLHVKLGTF
jgi:beta-galactosidase GanA